MKKIFERFMNYLHGAEVSKTFSEWLVENVSAFMKNIKALFSLTKLFEQAGEIQQRLTDIETQNDASKSEILKKIKSLNSAITTLSNNSKKSQEEITAEIQKLGKNIADELSILDESTRMLLVASVLDNLERAAK